MWTPVAQLQPWPAHLLSLPEWVISEDFELVSQGYGEGNVTVEEAVMFSFPFAPQTSPRHSSLDSQGLLHTPLSLSHPHLRLPSPPLALTPITLPSAPTPSLLVPFPKTSSDTPEHRTPKIYGSSLDLPWISPSSHGHPSPGLSLLPLSYFSCFTFISAPLLLSHLMSPYLASIFDPLYHH